MATVNKKDLIYKVAKIYNLHPRDVHRIVQSFLDQIIDSLLSGNRLEFRGFGIFEVKERKQKIGRNPKKASIPIVIPSRRVVAFSPGKRLKL